MAFVEGMVIKQMRQFLCVAVWEVLSFSASNVAIFRSVCMGPTLLD